MHIDRVLMILELLNAAVDVEDMRYPSSNLHKLEPKKDDRWSVCVKKNWSITFVFREGNASEVDYCDYH